MKKAYRHSPRLCRAPSNGRLVKGAAQAAPELNAMDQLFKDLKRLIAANRQLRTIDAEARFPDSNTQQFPPASRSQDLNRIAATARDQRVARVTRANESRTHQVSPAAILAIP